MQKQAGKIGTIHRAVQGRACAFCGGHQYQLILKSSCASERNELFARCTQCQHPRDFDADLGEIVWM